MGSSRTLAPAPPLPTTHIKDTKGINNMALVTKEAQALESRLEWDLAAKCSNYQQLFIMKKNQGNEQGIQSASSCAGMTPSERLIWYRANQPAVELDAERCAQSSNYRQLLLARGVRAIEETEEERAGRSATRSEALMWYRTGGRQMMEEDAERLGNCGTWQQYKLARDTRQHASSLTDSMNRHWSDFRSKEEVSDYISSIREESLKEREEIRAHVRSQVMSRASVAKECYEAHCQPWAEDQVEEESLKKASAELSAEERIEQLRRTTEEMITSRTEYVESTRSLAMRAMREDAESVAASRYVHRNNNNIIVRITQVRFTENPSLVHCNAMQCNAMQCNAMQCNAMHWKLGIKVAVEQA